MTHAIVDTHSLRWLWQKANISPDEAQESGHVRSLISVLEKIENPEGEFYGTRGIGLNWLDCFVCGDTSDGAQPDMAAFVANRDAGERIVKMFTDLGAHAYLDYRRSEPNWVQVKVGSCKTHEANLKLLHYSCGIDQRITPARIKYCL